MKRAAVPIAAAVVGVALACGPTKVEGSLQEILDLTYQDIKLGFAGDQIAVRWTRPRGNGQDTVLEVSEKLDGLTVRTGDLVNLAEPLPDFALADAGIPDGGVLPDGGIVSQQRGVVTRDVFNDPRKSFPLLSDGFMVLYDVPRDGGTVHGSFSVTFQRCVDFGCGRTVFGDFKAKVQ
ncbi:MAG TPA: hypothetical protein VLT82_02505 [Myxococcaceae bacterium]|nr:hypothetical protein [Myxococcaceae bacterium]